LELPERSHETDKIASFEIRMKNISLPFYGAIKQNYHKTEDKHPDFTGVLTIWNEIYEAAAWLAETSKSRPYISLYLTNDRDSHQERIKIAVWEHLGRFSIFPALSPQEWDCLRRRALIVPVPRKSSRA
jgi:hypothetical protein